MNRRGRTELSRRPGRPVTVYPLVLLFGVSSGLRANVAPALVSWAAVLGLLDLSGSGLALLGYAWTPWILTFFVLGEIVVQQLPAVEVRRTSPLQLGARLVSGGVSGAAIGSTADVATGGELAGVVGAALGTYAGKSFRADLAQALRDDRLAGLVESAVAIGLAAIVLHAVL